jgi:hypothetical protein
MQTLHPFTHFRSGVSRADLCMDGKHDGADPATAHVIVVAPFRTSSPTWEVYELIKVQV